MSILSPTAVWGETIQFGSRTLVRCMTCEALVQVNCQYNHSEWHQRLATQSSNDENGIAALNTQMDVLRNDLLDARSLITDLIETVEHLRGTVEKHEQRLPERKKVRLPKAQPEEEVQLCNQLLVLPTLGRFFQCDEPKGHGSKHVEAAVGSRTVWDSQLRCEDKGTCYLRKNHMGDHQDDRRYWAMGSNMAYTKPLGQILPEGIDTKGREIRKPITP